MRKKPGRYLALVVSLCLLFGAAVIACGTPSSAAPVRAARWHGLENTVVVAGSPSPQAGPARPLRLMIPAINVDAPVEAVGILPSGDLDTAGGSPWVDVGWYDQGSVPGQPGSAVIDGHVNRPGGAPAVFWNLDKLRRGNLVEVVDASDHTLRFQVTDVEYYTPQNAPLQTIFGNGGGSYLNLITCAGDWIPSQHQTTLRLVVYTRLVM